MTTCGICGRVGSAGFERVLVSDFEERPVIVILMCALCEAMTVAEMFPVEPKEEKR